MDTFRIREGYYYVEWNKPARHGFIYHKSIVHLTHVHLNRRQFYNMNERIIEGFGVFSVGAYEIKIPPYLIDYNLTLKWEETDEVEWIAQRIED